MNAQQVLDLLKKGNEINLILKNKNGEFYVNHKTNTLQNVYSYNFVYGVYGDLLNESKIDSLTHSDDEILQAIEKFLENGNLVPLSELPKIFSMTYV
ncbi:MAG: hypothetical protein ACLUQ0_08650 [Enterococcus italicus]|jgi:hypothetical protein|uniref:hypothetical protein n=1 Tax=Enterococcus italicus TaxID=246144 RepID=UPI0028A9FA21|nr:hypothetical protein [Enterococcus italicus]